MLEQGRVGLTVLVEHEDVATIEVDGVGGAEAGKAATDNNDTRRGHDELFYVLMQVKERVVMEREDERKSNWRSREDCREIALRRKSGSGLWCVSKALSLRCLGQLSCAEMWARITGS